MGMPLGKATQRALSLHFGTAGVIDFIPEFILGSNVKFQFHLEDGGQILKSSNHRPDHEYQQT